jgi:glycosyltransferase involved in cell wall biosynthesis
MNLLFTLTSYPPAVGGAQNLMHQLARELIQRHTLSVATQWDANRTDWLMGTTLRGPQEPRRYEIDGVPVCRIALPAAARRRLAPWVYGYYAMQGPALARIAAALARELAPLAAAADLIHNCRIGREGISFASLRVARERGIPFILTPVHHPRWGGWLHRHYHKLYREADAVIALTESERQTLTRLGVDPRRISVTGIGPVLSDQADGQHFRDQHGLGAAPVVLFLGQKYAYKGLAALLAAAPIVWRAVPEARFVFAGPHTPYSTKLFAGQQDRRILELDTLDLQGKTDALAACDVLCVPSTQESFGGVYTEAWSLGNPVIGADIPAVREVIAHGEDGLLVPQDAGAIAGALTQLLSNAGWRGQMGQRGQAKVAARYSWPRLAALTEEVYARAMRGTL